MKKVIVLQGDSDTGKTTTLKKVIAEILQSGAKLIDFSNNFGAWKHGSARRTADIWVILEYNGKKILIITAGDYPKMIKEKIKEAERFSGLQLLDIDILIFAAHESFAKSLGEEMSKETNIFSIISKSKNEDFHNEDECDEVDKKKVLEEIYNS